jgi:NAD(P)H-hydrate repair Nnr-like enzyme with NAD(P)H-hydrate epimerase domain
VQPDPLMASAGAHAKRTICERLPRAAGNSAVVADADVWKALTIGVDTAGTVVALHARYAQRKDALMTAEQSAVHDWMRLIQAEYLEMPGLLLTKAQVQRLWRLESSMCDTVLDALVAAEFLRKTHREAYVLASGVSQSLCGANA